MTKDTCKASKEALEKIMRGEVKQRSRWYFFFQNLILWVLGTSSVLIGSIIVSLVIFTAANSDIGIYREVYGHVTSCATIYLIGFWILITGVLIIISDRLIRRTKRGYMYPLWFILVIDIVLSIIFGTIFYFMGTAGYMDNELGHRVGYYNNIEKKRASLFNKPEKGILIGRVTRVGNQFVEIATVDKGLWIVFVDELDRDRVYGLQEGVDAIFAGKMNDSGLFVACDTRIVGLHGVHKKLQQQYTKAITQALDGDRVNIDSYLYHEVLSRDFCNDGVQWRIQVQR